MADFYDLITPAELTGYARQSLADRADNQFSLTRWLPHRQVNDLVYRFARGGGGLIEAASYRAFDAEPGFGRREGISRVQGELPPLGEQYVLGEYDHLRLRANAGPEIRDLLLRDAERISRSIDARLEIARGDALVNGSVTLSEDGVEATVDFGRDPSMEVTAAVVWSNHATSTPLDDIQAWTEAYEDINGAPPQAVLTSRMVFRHLLQNDQIRAQLYPNAPQMRMTPQDVNAFLEQWGLPPVTTYEARVRRDGVSTRIIPEDKFLLLPQTGTSGGPTEGELGATLWGTTAEAQEAGYGIGQGDHPGMVVAAFRETKTPIRVYTIGSAIGIPIMANPNLAMAATVL